MKQKMVCVGKIVINIILHIYVMKMYKDIKYIVY